MLLSQYKRPFLFFSLATFVPWSFWFLAGYLSHLPDSTGRWQTAASLLGLAGLISPLAIAFALMGRNPALRRDLMGRLFRITGIRPLYWAATLFLMLGSILVAQAISLLFGYSAEQFRFASHFSFSSGVFPVWFLLIAAPALEELAWHSYGTDALRNRFNLLTTSLIFGIYWGIWHIPLAGIKDYYQSNVVAEGWIFSVNFLVSILPFVLIMNWLYYKTGRSILITILFHISAGMYNEIFATDPMSKVIQTGVLVVIAIALIFHDRAFFLRKDTGGLVS